MNCCSFKQLCERSEGILNEIFNKKHIVPELLNIECKTEVGECENEEFIMENVKIEITDTEFQLESNNTYLESNSI